MAMKIKEYLAKLYQWNPVYYRIVHSLKTALACSLGLMLEKYYNWPSGQWVPITIMVVMSAQIHFGGAVHKASMRMLGTTAGVIITIFTLLIFGNNIGIILLTVFISVIFFTYIASGQDNISYAGTLGGVTVILILAGQNVGITEALQRGGYIAIGIIIALLVSRFIFPFHARDHLKYRIVTTLRNLSKLYLISMESQLANTAGYEKLNAKILKHINEQPKLLHEARIGSFTIAAQKKLLGAIIENEQTIAKLINLSYIARSEPGAQTLIEKYHGYLAPIEKVIATNLNCLADYLEYHKSLDDFEEVDTPILQIDLIAETLNSGYGGQQIILQSSLLFVAKQLLREIDRNKNLITKVNGKNSSYVV